MPDNTTPRVRVVVAEDESLIRRTLCFILEKENLQVIPATNGKEAFELTIQERPDLLLMDVMMPHRDGLDVLRELRATEGFESMPVILLTALSDSRDKVKAFENGADDYLTKPFNPRELIARVRAVLRRTRHPAHPLERSQTPSPRRMVRFGGFALDVDARVLRGPDGAPCKLTANKYSLLETLVQNANRVLTRDQLLERMQRQESDVFDRAIDVLILRLRRKIEINPSAPRFIRTERGFGYIFSVPDEEPLRQ